MLRTILAVAAAMGLLAGGLVYPADAAPRIVGFVDQRTFSDPDRDGDDLVIVRGWACAPAEPGRVLHIHMYDRTHLLFAMKADVRREPAVGRACGGNAVHGFRASNETDPKVIGELRVYAVHSRGVNRLLPDS